MEKLREKKCEPCGKGALPASTTEIEEFIAQFPDWQILVVDDIPQLSRSYRFKDFRQALEFTLRIGELAEQEQHHPAIITEWGRVRLSWWTHKIGGLHRNDFILAAKSDQCYQKD